MCLGAGCSLVLPCSRDSNHPTDSHCCPDGIAGAIKTMLILHVLQVQKELMILVNCSIDLLKYIFISGLVGSVLARASCGAETAKKIR